EPGARPVLSARVLVRRRATAGRGALARAWARGRRLRRSAVKIAWPTDGGLALARALLLADFVVTPIATSLEIVIRLAACGVILVMPGPRHRLSAVLSHADVI